MPSIMIGPIAKTAAKAIAACVQYMSCGRVSTPLRVSAKAATPITRIANSTGRVRSRGSSRTTDSATPAIVAPVRIQK